MRMRYGFGKITFCLCVLCAAAAIGSCGGGGGGDTVAPQSFPGFTPADTSVLMTDDEANTQEAAALILFAHFIGSVQGATGYVPASETDTSAASGNDVANAVLKLFRSELSTAPFQANQTVSGTDYCPGGSGTMTVTMSWTGPEQLPSSNPEVYCAYLYDVSMDLSMNDCAVDDTNSMTGLMSVQTTGQLCTPTAMNITMNNLSMYMGADTMQTRQLDLDLINITWNASMFSNGTMTSGTSVLNGQAVGVMDSRQYAAAFSNYTENMEMLGGSLVELNIAGMVTGPCLDGWTNIETVSPILYYEYNDCPHTGEVMLHCAGGAQIPVVFEADGGISIDDSIFYDSCDVVDAVCPW